MLLQEHITATSGSGVSIPIRCITNNVAAPQIVHAYPQSLSLSLLNLQSTDSQTVNGSLNAPARGALSPRTHRVILPLIRSKNPGAVDLTNAQIEELLD
jgi:hypothetical protein